MCRLSWNLGTSTSWNPQGLSRPVMGLLYLFTFSQIVIVHYLMTPWPHPKYKSGEQTRTNCSCWYKQIFSTAIHDCLFRMTSSVFAYRYTENNKIYKVNNTLLSFTYDLCNDTWKFSDYRGRKRPFPNFNCFPGTPQEGQIPATNLLIYLLHGAESFSRS